MVAVTFTPQKRSQFSIRPIVSAADRGARGLSASRLSAPSFATVALHPTIGRWPLWAFSASTIVISLILATVLVHRTGGTTYAYPYLILLPVILAGAVFKVPGGLIAAVAAALALGPWMPLEVASGTMQTTENWLVRMGMYVAIGGFTGALSTALYARQQQALVAERKDPVSGLISPIAAARLLPGADASERLGYDPAYAVVIAFEGLGTVLRTLGIDASNAAIHKFGHALDEAIGDTALVTRIHGSTFGILLPPGQRSMSLMVERIKERMPRAIEVGGFSVVLLPRFGIAKIDQDDRLGGQPFRKPMVALHLARSRWRRVARYSAALDRRARENLTLIGEFSEALEREDLSVHFQPKVDMATGRVFAAEALVRWKSAARGFVSPGVFVPLIERTTLIDPMTRFVADRSVQALADWRARGLAIDVAINLSTTNLQNPEFVAFLTQLPARYGVPASAIELEITETALMEDLAAAQATLERLRACGFLIAIDDFGTGHSSFRYLKELPIQWVKLDQSFVRDLPNNEASREISAATAAMCRRLNYKVIAEGVESAEALEFLRSQNYDAVQGYYYAKPLPAEAFIEAARKIGALPADRVPM